MIYLVTNKPQLFTNPLLSIISLEDSLELFKNIEEIGLDTETEGLDCYTKKLLLLQLGTIDFQVAYDISSYGGIIPQKLKQFLQQNKSLFVLQNAKFDLKFLFHQDIILTKLYDTMLAETIITNGLQYDGRDLKSLVEKYCGDTLDKSVRDTISTVGVTEAVIFYGAKDTKYLSLIKQKQLAFAKPLGLNRAIDLDNAFVIALAYTEYCGIKLDFEKWKTRTNKNIDELLILKNQLEDKLWKDEKFNYFSGMQDLFTGEQECILNWNSPKQVIALFKEYGINVTIKKKGESIETIDAAVLEPQIDKFEILKPYLNYKEKQKEISTYGLNWKNYINPVTGRIHTTFKQLMNTGRLSSGSKFDGTPNLQNIPSSHDVRSCFIPENDCFMIDADYSGQETIILANKSQEPNLLKFYEKGFNDMHSFVAFLMYPEIRICSVDEVTKEALAYVKKNHPDKRQIAKSAGFAIAYGGNGATIAKNCNISKKDGEFVYNSYFEAFPKMREYFDLVFRRASHFGYIEYSPITRRKYFFNIETDPYFALKDVINDKYFWQTNPNPKKAEKDFSAAESEIKRLAQNYPIQGESSDVTKYAAVLFFREILKRNWWMKVKIVNQVHDELLIECPKDIVEEVKEVLVYCMEEAGKPFCKTVPLKAEAIHGDYWVH